MRVSLIVAWVACVAAWTATVSEAFTPAYQVNTCFRSSAVENRRAIKSPCSPLASKLFSRSDSDTIPSPADKGFNRAIRSSLLHSLTTLIALVLLSQGAFAYDSSIFNNDYADPFHPLCKRHIEVSADGTTFHYSGTAVGPKDDPVRRGCSKEEIRLYKLRKGAFDGIILDGNRISAGDGIHEGVWEPANTATTNLGYEDKDGIRWNDGNKWIAIPKEEKSLVVRVGEVIFWSYLGFSTLAGAKGIYDGIQRRKAATD